VVVEGLEGREIFEDLANGGLANAGDGLETEPEDVLYGEVARLAIVGGEVIQGAQRLDGGGRVYLLQDALGQKTEKFD
jgi:hypothetical protein